ncbi:hypothetical protein [Candidatus Hodgkinia cicadicola]|uniref:hypothetical protein n=1 Tax=Candidatus Hodgkinia cicadicola TaxID=573658 RepID=UPI002415146B
MWPSGRGPLGRWLDVWAPGEGHRLANDIMLGTEYRWVVDVIVGLGRINRSCWDVDVNGCCVGGLLWLGGDGMMGRKYGC